MKKIIIGAVLVILGLPGTAFFFPNLIALIIGGLPILLILGGGLAVYLGWEDVRSEKELDDFFVPDETTVENQFAEPPADTPEQPLASDTREEKTSVEAKAPEAASPAEDTAGFVGNTDTMVFHSLSCKFSQGKKCTARFNDRDAAVDQGYKPCKVCNP